jgi:hypothetical protein
MCHFHWSESGYLCASDHTVLSFAKVSTEGGVPLDFSAFLGRVGLFVNDPIVLQS